jgi:DNA-binding response OmpR family regulator
VILRRTRHGVGTSPRRVGALTVDPGALEAQYAGSRLKLSRLEFALLCRLADDPLRVFTKRELLREVWGYPAEVRTRTLDAHACRLRRKLERVGAAGHVVNRRGVGYRLVDRLPELMVESRQDCEPGSGSPAVALRRLNDAA